MRLHFQQIQVCEKTFCDCGGTSGAINLKFGRWMDGYRARRLAKFRPNPLSRWRENDEAIVPARYELRVRGCVIRKLRGL